MFKIKDLNHKLADLLDDKNLLNVNNLNRECVKIYDNIYYKRRLTNYLKPEILKIENENWKEFYYMIKYYLTDDNHVSKIKRLINQDRVDILSLLFKKYGYSYKPIYNWSSEKRDILDPMNYAITKDSEKCFLYLSSFDQSLNVNVFKYHAHKIIQTERFRNMASIQERINGLIFIFLQGCASCYNSLYSKDLEEEIIEEIYHTDISNLLKEYSEAFSLFIKSIDISYYRNQANNRNRYDIVKLLTIYSSRFRDFHM